MSLKLFYASPYYQIRSFAFNFAFAAAACILLFSLRPAEFYTFSFSSWQLLYIPLGIYVGGISAVFIHNATHHSFPKPALNTFCGWLAGFHQLWGYRGWKLIHLIHHNYSDKPPYDPHSPKDKSFLQFTKEMFVGSSFAVSRRYREHWGDTPRTRAVQMLGLGIFAAQSLAFLALWFLLLGPEAFLFFYVPSFLFNHWFFCSINYYCHPLDAQKDETVATNLNHGWYYPLANALWFGIYFHGNHHRKPNLFNPRHLKERVREAAPQVMIREVEHA